MKNVNVITVVFTDEHALRWLRSLGLPLGSIAARTERIDRRGLWFIGSVMICSHCTKVVGVWHLLRAPQFHILDPNAGWVLERRVNVSNGEIFCGSGGCYRGPVYEHPLACSDECEQAILADWRHYEHCEPPPGYQRGGPHP